MKIGSSLVYHFLENLLDSHASHLPDDNNANLTDSRKYLSYMMTNGYALLGARAAAGSPDRCFLQGSGRFGAKKRPAAGGRLDGAVRRSRAFQARSMYRPVRVSMRRTVPASMKSGTVIAVPVSRIAFFDPPCAVSPRTPGSVSFTAISTKSGSSTVIGLIAVREQRHDHILDEIGQGVSDNSLRYGELLVGLDVHQIVEIPRRIEELTLPALEPDLFDLIPSHEGLFEHVSLGNLLEPRAHDRTPLLDLDVLKLDDREELPVDLDDRAAPEIARVRHRRRTPGIRAAVLLAP